MLINKKGAPPGAPDHLALADLLLLMIKVGVNLGKDVAKDGTKQEQNSNYNDCNQNKDQRILHQALAFFLRGEQHRLSPPFALGFL